MGLCVNCADNRQALVLVLSLHTTSLYERFQTTRWLYMGIYTDCGVAYESIPDYFFVRKSDQS
jgi:hypothetical protein